jgi:hypothetical protein
MTFSCVSRVNFGLPESLLTEIKSEIPEVTKLGYKSLRRQSFKQAFKLIAEGKFEDTVIKYNDIVFNVSKDDLLDLRQRLDSNNINWAQDTAFFVEKQLNEDLQIKIVASLHKELQALDPIASIQTKFARYGPGLGLPPHKDHNRTATLWYLLEGLGEETSWWQATEYFKEYEFWQIADLSKIKEVHKQVLELNTWYVFDHKVYHSVTPVEDIKKRSSLCIEFNNISAEELSNLVEKIYV